MNIMPISFLICSSCSVDWWIKAGTSYLSVEKLLHLNCLMIFIFLLPSLKFINCLMTVVCHPSGLCSCYEISLWDMASVENLFVNTETAHNSSHIIFHTVNKRKMLYICFEISRCDFKASNQNNNSNNSYFWMLFLVVSLLSKSLKCQLHLDV